MEFPALKRDIKRFTEFALCFKDVILTWLSTSLELLRRQQYAYSCHEIWEFIGGLIHCQRLKDLVPPHVPYVMRSAVHGGHWTPLLSLQYTYVFKNIEGNLIQSTFQMTNESYALLSNDGTLANNKFKRVVRKPSWLFQHLREMSAKKHELRQTEDSVSLSNLLTGTCRR